MKNCSPDDPAVPSLRITFDANGGRFSSGADSVKVKTDADGCVELPVAPERSGHYFDGYFLSRSGGGTQVTSETVFDRSTTVYAQWTKAPALSKRYYLYDPRTDKFDKTEYMDIDGDKCVMTGIYGDETIVYTGTVNINGNKITVKLQVEVLDGLFMKTEFGGIVESNGVIYFNVTTVEGGEEKTIYDYYCPDGVKPINPVIPELQPAVVTFDANGGKFSDGSSQKKITADKDGKVVFPVNPTKAGYEFEGFTLYSSGGIVTKDTVFDFGNVTVYAKYAKYYTVTFKVGTKTVETRKVAEGKQLGTYDIPAPTGEENAIMFKGWKGNRNSYDYYTPTSRIDSYLTLTAEFYTQQDFQQYMSFMKYWQKPGHFYIHYRNKYDKPRDVDMEVTRNYLKNTVYEDWLLWAWQKNGSGRAFEPIHIGMFGIVFDIDMRTTYYDGGWDAVNKTDKGESLTFYRKDFGIMFFDDKSRYDGAYWKRDGEQLNLLYEMFIYGDMDDEGNIIGNESYAFDESISLNTLFLAGEISQADVDNGMLFFTGYYS